MAVNESNYNTLLAEALEKRMPGWNVRSQQDISANGGTRKHPDAVAASPSGTLIAVEAKFATPSSNLRILEGQAEAHLGRRIRGRTPTVSVSVVYPAPFKKTRARLREVLEVEGGLRFAAWTAGEGGAERFPASGYLTGGLDGLADLVETAVGSDRRTAEMTEEFSAAVSAGAEILGGKHPAMAEVVKQEPGEQTDQMTSSLILNALIFHHQVAVHHRRRISPPTTARGGMRPRLLKEWAAILEINYWPIFKIASDLLAAIGDEPTAEVFLDGLTDTATRMASEDAHVTQNLAGHVFGTLLADRKFLASFYTLPPAATLLAELAVERLDADWGNPEAVGNLRVADFACGSGALLSAAYARIRSRVRRRGVDDEIIHRKMLEEVFVGCDIMPAGVHITAATLSSVHPKIDYTKTETHVMPIGPYRGDVDGVRAGSLELLAAEDTGTLFGDGSEMVAAKTVGGVLKLKHNSCDLVIMNPPFTAPTNHAKEERKTAALPQFAAFGMDKTTQKKIGAKVKKMIRKLGVYASDGNAGLATDFFDLAHRKLKPGGVLAFVLPVTLATGSSWEKLRGILASEYEDVIVITCSSGSDEHRRFSSDTHMAEALLVATRRESSTVGGEEDWRWINLESNPKSTLEASAIAEQIFNKKTAAGKPVSDVFVGDTRYGFQVTAGRKVAPALLRSPGVVEAMLALTDSARPGIVLPRSNQVVDLPLTRLGALGTGGPLARDIEATELDSSRGPFIREPHPGGEVDFPILWEHRAKRHENHENRLVVHPDVMGLVVSDDMKAKAAAIWKTATRLHFNVDFGLGSQSLAACLTPAPTLGGRAWPSFTLHAEGEPAVERMDWVYPVLLWANTTLGLMSFYTLGTRAQAVRSSLSLTRQPDLPVLDPRTLTPGQIAEAAAIFGEFKDREFLPARKAAWDETRRDLDAAVLTRLLGFGDETLERVEVIRDQWCREPHLTGDV